MFQGHVRLEVLRQGPGTVDRYGQPVPGPIVATPVRGELVPIDSTENLAAADQVVTRFKLYLPAANGGLGAPKSTDEVRADGIVYAIKGQPEPHRYGGRLHHWEAVLERVTG